MGYGAEPPHREGADPSPYPHDKKNPWWQGIPKMYSSYQITDSESGAEHQVLDMEVLGPTLQYVFDHKRDSLSKATARRYIRALLRILDYVHRSCGVIHSGQPFHTHCSDADRTSLDLRAINILFRVTKLTEQEEIDRVREALNTCQEDGPFLLPFLPEPSIPVITDFGSGKLRSEAFCRLLSTCRS